MQTVKDMLTKYEEYKLTIGEQVSNWLNKHIVDMEGHISDDMLIDYIDSLTKPIMDGLKWYANESNWLSNAVADQGDKAREALCK